MPVSTVSNGDMGWVGLVVYVVAYDVWALHHDRRTLSSAFRSIPRVLTVPICAYVCAHLFGLMPEHHDPLARVAAALTPSTRERE